MRLLCLLLGHRPGATVWTYRATGDRQHPAKRKVEIVVLGRECERCGRIQPE